MVLDGRYPPGEALPREGDLAGELRVSRTSIREAVKVLSAKGLLEARPRTDSLFLENAGILVMEDQAVVVDQKIARFLKRYGK